MDHVHRSINLDRSSINGPDLSIIDHPRLAGRLCSKILEGISIAFIGHGRMEEDGKLSNSDTMGNKGIMRNL